MRKERLAEYCDRVSGFALYVTAFYIPVSTALVESFAGVAIAAWLLKKFFAGEGAKKIFSGNALALPVLVYTAACLVSALLSSNLYLSLRHFLLKTVEYALLFFIAADIAERKFLRNILFVFMLSVGLVGLDGVFQYFSGFDFFRGRTPAVAGRINGPFTTPNDFSSYVVTLLPLAASLCFMKFRRRWLKAALTAVSLALFVCLILAASRSAWVAMLSAIPLLLFLNRRLFVTLILLIAAGLILVNLLPASIARSYINGLFSGGGRVLYICERPFLLEMGMNMFAAAPIVGQGLGTFMFNFNKFQPVALGGYPSGWGISYAHNCFLQIAAETGLLGLLSFLFVIITLFYSSFRLLRKMQDTGDYFILSGLSLGIFTYLVSSLFDTNFYSLPLAVLFWLMLGLAAGTAKIIKQEKGYG